MTLSSLLYRNLPVPDPTNEVTPVESSILPVINVIRPLVPVAMVAPPEIMMLPPVVTPAAADLPALMKTAFSVVSVVLMFWAMVKLPEIVSRCTVPEE